MPDTGLRTGGTEALPLMVGPVHGADAPTTSARDAASTVDSGAPQLTRWQRIPEGNSCDWCNDMATQDYGSAEAASLNDEHSNCHCDVVPA